MGRAENRSLTGLRGVASLWVVFFHLGGNPLAASLLGGNPAIQAGYAAVDLFFILSGFIIAEVYRDLRFPDVAAFLIKRGFRLFPLHWAAMAFLAVVVLTAGRFGFAVPQTGYFSWRLFPVFMLLLQPYLYAGLGWNMPSWSIGIELACYAAYPFGAVMLRRLTPRQAAGLAMISAVASAVALQHFGNVSYGPGALIRGILGFAAGGLIAAAVGQEGVGPRPSLYLQVTGLILVVLAVMLPAHGLVSLAAAAMVAGMAGDHGLLGKIMATPVAHLLGNLSFSIYLLHSPFLFLAGKLIPPARFARIGLHGAMTDVASVVVYLSVLLAASLFTYRAVETPGRRLGAWIAGRMAPGGFQHIVRT